MTINLTKNKQVATTDSKTKKVVSKKQLFTMESMTNREKEVFLLIKKGLTSKECAVALDISVRTVEVHRSNLIQKYQVKNIVELVFRINQQAQASALLH